jgi:hypothetical protein
MFARRNRGRGDSIPHQYRPYRQLVHLSATVLGQDKIKLSVVSVCTTDNADTLNLLLLIEMQIAGSLPFKSIRF